MREWIGDVADRLCTRTAERLGLWRIFHPIMIWAWNDEPERLND